MPDTGRGMSGHQSSRADSNVWLTPRGILFALGHFDLDPCAAEDRPWPTADRHIAPPDDGLAADWSGRVWLNPPYRDLEPWLARLAEHRHGTALVFARTETAWFQQYVWGEADAVLFLAGRITFCLPDGSRPRGNAGAGSALVAYGRRDSHALAESGLGGTLIDGHCMRPRKGTWHV